MRARLPLGALLAIPAVAALTLSACTVSTGSESGAPAASAPAHPVKKIVFDFPYTALPIYTTMSRYTKEEAAARGIEIEFTNDNMDLNRQISNLTTYATRKDVDAVISFAMDPNAVGSIVRQYRDNGKYFISYGGDIPGQDASIQFSFTKAGDMLAESAGGWISRTLHGKAKVLVLKDESNQIGKERTQGIVDGLKKYAPEATIVDQQQAITPEQGLSMTSTVLAKHPDIDVVLAAVGDAAQGAYQGLVAAGRPDDDPDTYVGGLDGNTPLLQSMKDGKMVRGLVSVKPREMAKAVVDVPVGLGEGNASVKDYNAPVYLITKESPDLDEWIKAGSE
ncbi:sugar ABC transporter substrate-binding protein [Actinokineospora enzanensis]|uniref:sugar ABC transporter substrate-binding protein n=1 Tax=Actinokineospora enzanensis TaxID=155975 RepID=UPI00037A039F|nr:sugar ABC transporter substrate-binding protein [Actinokineospora enzanensis]